jgi:hypothetical protein
MNVIHKSNPQNNPMEATWTKASDVRKRLKAGRPKRIVTEQISLMDAMLRIIKEADTARGLMSEAGLDPDDITISLVFLTPNLPGCENDVMYKELLPPGRIGEYVTDLEKVAALANNDVWFIGIIWRQKDREAQAQGRPWKPTWVTQFVGGPVAERHLKAARDKFMVLDALKDQC